MIRTCSHDFNSSMVNRVSIQWYKTKYMSSNFHKESLHTAFTHFKGHSLRICNHQWTKQDEVQYSLTVMLKLKSLAIKCLGLGTDIFLRRMQKGNTDFRKLDISYKVNHQMIIKWSWNSTQWSISLGALACGYSRHGIGTIRCQIPEQSKSIK